MLLSNCVYHEHAIVALDCGFELGIDTLGSSFQCHQTFYCFGYLCCINIKLIDSLCYQCYSAVT